MHYWKKFLFPLYFCSSDHQNNTLSSSKSKNLSTMAYTISFFPLELNIQKKYNYVFKA